MNLKILQLANMQLFYSFAVAPIFSI